MRSPPAPRFRCPLPGECGQGRKSYSLAWIADSAIYPRLSDDARIAIEMTVDELAARLEQRFEGLEQKFENLEQKMDDGFEASKIRDEELRDLMAFGLEAREVLRDEMHRRFDAAGHKHDEQIGLLNDVIRQNLAKP